MVLLVDLPHELLAAILATHSPSVLSLYKCGSKALSLKLFHRGVTQIHLQNSKRFYLPYFPVIIPSFRYLRSLSIIRCGSYIANYSSTTEALKQLPSSLEELVLDFANSGPTFCSILRPVSTSAATLTPANDDTFETIHGFDDPSDFPFLRKLQLADLGFEPSVVSRLGQLTSLTDLHAHIGLHDSEEHDLSTLNSYLPKGLLRLTVELPWQPPIASLSNLPPVLEYLKIVTKEEYRAHIEPGIAASLPRTLRTFKSDCFAFLFSVAMMNALPPLITEIYYEMISGDIPDVLKAIPSEVTVLRTRYPSNQHFALSHIPHLPQGLKVLTAAFMNIDNGDNLFSFPPKITSLKLEIHDPSNSLTSMLPPHLTKLILVQGPYLTREDIGLLPRTLRRLQIWLAAETSEMPTPVVWPPYLEELLIYDSIGARADPDNPGASTFFLVPLGGVALQRHFFFLPFFLTSTLIQSTRRSTRGASSFLLPSPNSLCWGRTQSRLRSFFSSPTAFDIWKSLMSTTTMLGTLGPLFFAKERDTCSMWAWSLVLWMIPKKHPCSLLPRTTRSPYSISCQGL